MIPAKVERRRPKAGSYSRVSPPLTPLGNRPLGREAEDEMFCQMMSALEQEMRDHTFGPDLIQGLVSLMTRQPTPVPQFARSTVKVMRHRFHCIFKSNPTFKSLDTTRKDLVLCATLIPLYSVMSAWREGAANVEEQTKVMMNGADREYMSECLAKTSRQVVLADVGDKLGARLVNKMDRKLSKKSEAIFLQKVPIGTEILKVHISFIVICFEKQTDRNASQDPTMLMGLLVYVALRTMEVELDSHTMDSRWFLNRMINRLGAKQARLQAFMTGFSSWCEAVERVEMKALGFQ